ncbi:MAG: PAS domain S-box protein, partial [Spirochaetaceae bacterium]
AQVELKTQRENLNNALAHEERTTEKLLEKTEELEEAKIAEENYRNELDLIFDSVPAMIWRKDLDGRIVRVNRTGCEFLCLSAEQILGKTSWDLFPPELAEQLESDDTVVIQARRPVYGVVRRFQRPSGELSVLRIDKVPFTDVEGTLRGTIGFVVDITAEAMAEDEAKDNERFLRSIIDNSHDMIEVLDTNGNYTFVGRARTLAGYDSEDLIGMNAFEHVRPDQRGEAAQLFDKLILTGDPQTMEVMHQRPDGSWMWLETTGRRIEYRGETRVLLNTRDITERKTAERIATEKRQEQETRLREAHHRVKNNLAAVYCMLARKADSLADRDAKNALGDAQRCLQAIAMLYDRLAQTNHSERLSIRDYLGPLVDEIIAAVPTTIRIESRTEIEDIVVASERLSTLGLLTNELLTNAMNHAFKEMTEGVVWVSASLFNDEVVLTVRDNGVGLPRSVDIDHPTGMGLTLVRALTEQIGGMLSVDRTSGTRFEVRFPLDPTDTNSEATASCAAACGPNHTW